MPISIAAQTSVKSESLFVTTAGGQPVAFASVSIKGGSLRVTDAEGLLLIRGADDSLNMLVRRIGFVPFQGKVGRSAADKPFRVTLPSSAQQLGQVVVHADGARSNVLEGNGFYSRMLEVQRGAPTGEFFTPEELESRSSGKISQFLQGSRYAKVNQVTSDDAGRFKRSRAVIYGRANCVMQLLVDGVVMHGLLGENKDNGLPGYGSMFSENRVGIDDMVNAQDVMAVEVYPSIATAPMSIASKVLGSTCGIVAIWTGARR